MISAMATYVTRFPVTAPPERVWQVLTALEGYGDWNPQIPTASGSTAVGGNIELRLALPGRPAMNVTATIEESDPACLLTWRGHVLAPWFFQGYRRFEIEPTPDGCDVTHREEITGALSPVFSLLMGKPTAQSHRALNDALREQAEAPATA